jgi:type I restriction enzyme, R subunit
VQIYEPKPGDDPVPPDELDGDETVPADGRPPGEDVITDPREPPRPDGGEGGKRVRYFVNDVPVYVIKEQYYGPGGKLITESLRDFTRKSILQEFASLDHFLRTWKAVEKKQAIIEELQGKGIFFEALAEEVGRDLDPLGR